MAIKTIPNTFLRVEVTWSESTLDSHPVDFRMIKMMIKFTTMPAMILKLSYSDFSEMIVVSVPAPAKSGKAMGTILPEPPSSCVSLKKRIPNIISSPIKNIINAPASANELTSIWKRLKMPAPKNKNAIMMVAAAKVAKPAWIFTPSFFMLMMIGKLPMMSITENKISVTDKIAFAVMSKVLNNLLL